MKYYKQTVHYVKATNSWTFNDRGKINKTVESIQTTPMYFATSYLCQLKKPWWSVYN